jgi:3-oxoacyl-[acyl-carrier protein] reductase
MFDFRNRTALVVGGSSGIGNGIAQAFRACGARVHVWGTRASTTDYACDAGSELSGLRYECVDASKFDKVDAYTPPFNALDVLVLCQGAVLYKRKEFTMEGFTRVVDVNLNSIMACAKKFQSMLAETKGSIVVISSTAAYRSTKGNPAYAASKAGTLGLIRSLGEAWAPLGIRVNGIAPGMVRTKMTEVTIANPARLRAMLASIPLGRLGTPVDIAGVALFLASPHAGYIVGHVVVVDGGALLS